MSSWSIPRLLGLSLVLALPILGLGPAAPVALAAPGPVMVTAGLEAAWSPPGTGEVLRPFDPPEQPWAAGHRGVDWAVPDGRVLAPAAGTVHFAGEVAGRPVITVAHAGGLYSSLEPVSAAEGLAVGDPVADGQALGSVPDAGSGGASATGHCPQRCVHWGVRLPDGWMVDGSAWDRYLDPLVLLGWSGPSVLWPLEGGPPSG